MFWNVGNFPDNDIDAPTNHTHVTTSTFLLYKMLIIKKNTNFQEIFSIFIISKKMLWAFRNFFSENFSNNPFHNVVTFPWVSETWMMKHTIQFRIHIYIYIYSVSSNLSKDILSTTIVIKPSISTFRMKRFLIHILPWSQIRSFKLLPSK